MSSQTSQIIGRVVDGRNGQPISGKVIVNIDESGGGWANTVLTSPDGHFESDVKLGLLPKENFTLTFLAVDASGTVFIPKILIPTNSCQITQGTNIGTISLMPGSSATVTALVTAQTASGTPASISEQPEGIFEKANGTLWAIPWSTFIPERQTLQPGPSCPANTACTQITTKVSGNAALSALFSGSSTQFQPVDTQAIYALTIDPEPNSEAGFSGHCSQQAEFQPPTPVPPGSTTVFGPFNFISCQ